MRLFTDISSFQGYRSVTEFKQMKKDGISAVTVKLTEGTTYTNPTAQHNISNAKAAGLMINAYHFARFSSPAEAESEANHFTSTANKLGVSKKARMALDIEVPLGGNMTQNCLAFLGQVRKNGFQNVDWYSYQGFIDAHLSEKSLPGRPWKAAYPAKVDRNHPPFGNCGAWQYTNGTANYLGRLVGLSGKFDVSADYAGGYTTAFKTSASVSKPAQKTTTYYVKSTFLNIYSAPGGKIIGKLNRNDRVQVMNVDTNWTTLSSNGHSVFVLTSGLSKTKSEQPSANVYSVKPGDSLWAIATSHGMSVQQLKSINHLTSDTIFPNQKLILGSESSRPCHTVVAGDSLWSIATVNKTTVQELKAINHLTSDVIHPNQKLYLK